MTGARTWKSFVFFARQRERVAAQPAAVQLMVFVLRPEGALGLTCK